jgi:hypothetical protein
MTDEQVAQHLAQMIVDDPQVQEYAKTHALRLSQNQTEEAYYDAFTLTVQAITFRAGALLYHLPHEP